MARKSMEARIQAAFGTTAPESIVLDYLGQLRTNMDLAEKAIRRISLQTLFLLVLFVLLTREQISGATVLYFSVKSVEFLAFLIPIAVAYLYVHVPIYIKDLAVTFEAHYTLIGVRYPSIAGENLELIVTPPPNMLGQGVKIAQLYDAKNRSFAWAIASFLSNAPLVAMIGIIIYMVWELFARYGAANMGVWLSAAATAVLTVVSMMMSYSLLYEDQSDVGQGPAE